MSAFFIFKIKRAKSDKIFNFLNGPFSLISGSMDMIFGVFLETNVRLHTQIGCTDSFEMTTKNLVMEDIKAIFEKMLK